MRGRPAQGVKVALYEVGASARGLLTQTTTNADGRTDAPLISGEPLRIGIYELQFDIGGYFPEPAPPRRLPPSVSWASCRCASQSPSPKGAHVPLLATPWSYTTYRGS